MIANFDRYGKFETPGLTLCNPGSTTDEIGITTYVVSPIPFPSNVEVIFNFSEPSELNFTSSCPRGKAHDGDTNNTVYENVSKIKVNRLVYVDGIGYFSIDSVKDYVSENVYYKDVSAKSIDVEFRNRNIPYIENGQYAILDTVVTIDDEEVEIPGILNKIVGSLPLWEIEHVDSALDDRIRTINDVDVSNNCLGFMNNTIQDLFECIISFDIKNRKLSVYDKNTYEESANVFLSYNDVLKSVNGELSYDKAITALNVHGDGDIGIAAVNPAGTNTIYNYSEYLSWMPEQLAEKVVQWQDLCAENVDEYADIGAKYYWHLSFKSTQQLILDSHTRCVELYNTIKDNIISSGNTDGVDAINSVLVNYNGQTITVSSDVASTLAEIDEIIAGYVPEMREIKDNIRSVEMSIAEEKAALDEINSLCSMDTFFTNEELGLLSLYTFEGSYTDSDIVITESMPFSTRFEQMRTLYYKAVSKLNEAIVPQKDFSVESDDFIFSEEFGPVTKELDVGKFVYVDVGGGDYERLLLHSVTVNYDDKNVSMKFGNKYSKNNPKAVFDSIFDGISKTANSLSYVRDVVYDGRLLEVPGLKRDLEQLRTIVLQNAGTTPVVDEGYANINSNNDIYSQNRAVAVNNTRSIKVGNTTLTEEDLIKLLQMIKG